MILNSMKKPTSIMLALLFFLFFLMGVAYAHNQEGCCYTYYVPLVRKDVRCVIYDVWLKTCHEWPYKSGD